MAENPNSVNDRLQQASQGNSPQLDPDQQRRYLGTFRERVSLAIPVSDANNNEAQQDLDKDMANHSNYILTINGALINENTAIKYEQIAMKHNIKFTMADDSNFNQAKYSYGIVLAHPSQPINQPHVLWNKKYPSHPKINSEKKAKQPKHNNRFLNKLKHLF